MVRRGSGRRRGFSSRRGGRRRVQRGAGRRRAPQSSGIGRRIAGSFGQLIYNFARRMIAAPMQMRSTETIPQVPWTVGLMTIPTLLLKVVTTAFAKASSNDWKDIRTGSAFCYGITIDDLIWSGPVSFDVNSTLDPHRPPAKLTNFQQGRVEWLKVIISPVVDIEVRGGNFSAAIVGISDIDELRSLYVDRDGVLDYVAIANLPGAVIAPATRAVTLSWRPQPNSFSAQWHEIGHSGNNDTLMGDRGSLPIARFHLHYRDMAVNDDSKAPSQYTVDRALFDVTFESRVHLRSINTELPHIESTQHTLRNAPVEFFQPKSTTMMTQYGRVEMTPAHYRIEDGERLVNMNLLFPPVLVERSPPISPSNTLGYDMGIG
jgi:hypothetical protein